jgi:peptide/nickel transport system substrate-binding protein
MQNRLSKFLVIAVALLLMATAVLGCQPAPAPVAEPPVAEAPVAEAPKAEATKAEAPAPAAEEPAPAAEEPAPVDSGPVLARNETLYVAGHQWSPLVGWNPYSSNNNNWGIAAGASARVIIFETPYMYNMIDGGFYPLLAEGDYEWNDEMTEITFKLKPAAKWSDGTPLTAEDVAYTYATHLKYETGAGVNYGEFIETIEAVDTHTVLVKAALNDEGKAVNPLQVISYLCSEYVAQKAWTETLEGRVDGDATELKADTGEDFVASGPYKQFFSDDQKVVFVRDDNYWGQDASMWGKLPPPKYLAHQIYGDNNAGFIALKAGQVDVSQQFNANVQDLWLVDKLPISTYMDEAPYSITASLPTAYFNLKKHGLDRVEVRKAIAMAVDYDTIIANAMTNQSPTFQQVPRSVMNPTDGEQALYDHAAVKDLQFAGDDIEGAKKLLDDAGIVDTDGDGYRDIDGKRLSYNAVCPNGWSDWQAAIEIVAAAGEKIGIEIVTYFPEWGVYQTVFTDGNQEEYDIFMVWSNGAGPTNPWGRVRQLMSSEFAGTTGNWNGNWGGYVNPRIDELVKLIPNETDMEKLKEYYTEATKIYLTDVPSFSLMYRPDQFHTVNETVWTNYPEADDGLNIPPTNLINGYGVAGLYNITLVNP